jgi:hypothetical protein
MSKRIKHPVGELSEKLLLFFVQQTMSGKHQTVQSMQDEFIGAVIEYEDKFYDAIDEAYNAGRTDCGGEPKQGYAESKYLPLYERRI